MVSTQNGILGHVTTLEQDTRITRATFKDVVWSQDNKLSPASIQENLMGGMMATFKFRVIGIVMILCPIESCKELLSKV